ncbi:MAG: TRAP transporter TatT component family protein [Desulfobacterales bacterium]|nr:TRAP transporter TatT component family protein [Desulfobacterales bacterium]
MGFSRNWKGIFSICFTLAMAAACIPNKQMTVGSAATLLEDVANSANKQSDLKIVREGMPAYLMLIDGMVEAVPDNARLLITAAQAYASFASAFIEDADTEYARALYQKAKTYALRALELRGLKNPVSKPFDAFEEALNRLDRDEVPYMFWTATCWGSWIRLSLGSMAAVAELPRVEALMKRVLVLDEEFYFGGPHLFMGMWFASRPKIAGGDLTRAQQHFQKALGFSRGKFLMTQVYYADQYARKTLDRKLFVTTLQNVLETPVDTVPQLTVLNTVAHKKAKKMLEQVDTYF